MDIDGLRALLARIERAEVTCVARDLSEPSPLAHELVNARPYAFLDDAPLEERRTQAVQTRRLVDAKSARDLSALDPEAIARVVAEARLEPRDADELHDLLLVHAALPESEGREYQALFAELCAAGRAGCLTLGPARLWVAAERSALWRLVAAEATLEPPCAQPACVARGAETREQALREVVRGRLEAVGPVTAAELTAALGLSESDVEVGLFALEAEGFVLRGHYRPGAHGLEWCERRLLARIHRATLDRLRSEIEPVSPAVLLRFLAQHQHVSSDARLSGIEGLSVAIGQLSGFELAASAWESDVLPLRVSGYAPEQLDLLCFSGRVSWARAGRPVGARDVSLLPRRPPNKDVDVSARAARIEGPIRTTPIALYARESMSALRGEPPACPPLSSAAERVRGALAARGASFVSELSRATALEPAHVQEALGELIGQGLVTSDGFAGLRSLIALGKARPQADAAGRYALLASEQGHAPADPEARLVALAHCLLARWGIVLRKLLERESSGVRWGELLPVLRRMEARGELRGGRFVANFGGEQYALPEVVGQLRKLRKQPPSGELLAISASDPLNLVGIIAPGTRIPAQPSTRILLRDGVPVAALSAGACQCLIEASDAERTLFEAALRGRAGALRAPGLSWPAQA
jgi:ATP-dependent Lhr-like helicase